MIDDAQWCDEHDETVPIPCDHLGTWESDVQPCPSCADGQLQSGVSCYTCAGARTVDRGKWGDCPGPHHPLEVRRG